MRQSSSIIISFLNRECKKNMHSCCRAKWDGLGFSVECSCTCHYKTGVGSNCTCAGAKKAEPINLSKRFEQHIGRRYIIYTFSPNGRVQIAIRSSDTPFKLEDDEDISILFSFFGQVRDRLICYVSDVRETAVPLTTEWILKDAI
jgi:hypothetical protein